MASRLYVMTKRVLIGCLIIAGVLLFAKQSSGQEPLQANNWTRPESIALEKNQSVATSQSSSNFLQNMDCRLVTYRYTDSSAMTSGCFTEMAFGLMDADSNTVIFNDTDEAIKIIPHSASDGLIPWPQSGNAIVLTGVSTGGMYLNLYKDPFSSSHDQRNLLGQITAKKLDQPPDLALRDNQGNRVIVNAQTIGFSSGGSWMVAETLNGSFVRVNLATLAITPFAKSYGSMGSPALLKTSLNITDDGRFVAMNNDSAGEFKVFDLDSCIGVIDGVKPLNCQSLDYLPKIKQTVGVIRFINKVRFINDDLLSFEVSSDSDNSGSWLMAPADSIKFKSEYLGMGDSYTSGEGAYDYILGTDNGQNMCHISKRSYPLLLSADLFGQTAANSVACSGAVINDVGSLDEAYRGQMASVADYRGLQNEPNNLLNTIFANHLPGYVAQQRFINIDRPRILTVSVGGDDIGFGEMVKNCVLPHLRPGNTNDCYGSFEDQLEIESVIKRTEQKWRGLFTQLKRQSAGGKVYALGYPSVANPDGKCSLNVHLSRSELKFTETTVNYLNETIARAAKDSDIHYVDITNALVGHRFCEAVSSQTAMNGLTAGKDAGILGLKFFGKESYHPNALGHQLIEQAILKQTKNFTDEPPAHASAVDTIATGAKTGRLITKLVPSKNLTSPSSKKGSTIKISVKTPLALKPSSKFTVHLGSSTGRIIGEISTDSNGLLDGEVTMPSEIDGGQTIHVVGPDITETSSDLTQPIFIPASENDADGDGISDNLDSCPGATNSAQDNDNDGVDDVCSGVQISNSSPGSTSVISGPISRSSNLSEQSAKETPNTFGQSSITPSTNTPSKGSIKITSNRHQDNVKSIQSAKPAIIMSEPKVLGSHVSWQVLPVFNWKLIIFICDLLVVIIFVIFRIAKRFRLQY